MMRLAMSGLRVLGILALLGPAVALACRREMVVSDWSSKTPDGRFELVRKTKDREQQIALIDLQKVAILWTHPLSRFGDFDTFLLAPDGSAFLGIEARARRVTLHGRAGETLGTWPLEKLLTRSEIERLPHITGCEELAWMTQQRVEGNTFTFALHVGDTLEHFFNESRHIAFELSTTGELKREPPRIDGTPSELIQRYHRERSPLTRLQIAEELWMASREERTRLSAELPAFWLSVLKDPLTPRGVLTVAVASLDSCGAEADFRSLSQVSPGAPERDIAILGLLAKKLPQEAGAFAVRMLERPHPSSLVRAASIHHLLEQGGTAAQRGNEFLHRDAALHTQEDVSPRMYAEYMALQEFWLTFPLCAGPTEQRKAMAARAMLHVVEAMDTGGPALVEMSDTLEASPKSDCAGALFLLGTLAERNKDTMRASRLYRTGLARLATASAEQQKDAQALILEAKLRLALLSQDAERQRLLGEVLADPARSTEVCLSRPFGSWQYWTVGQCEGLKPAEAVARQLLLQARAQGAL